MNSKINSSSISLVNPIQVENISSCELEKAACCNLAESFETNAMLMLILQMLLLVHVKFKC